MKNLSLLSVLISFILCLTLTSCTLTEIRKTNYFGFDITKFTVVREYDSHGGFHGDGSYYLILDCSENSEQAQEIIKNWNPLPLTENLELVMYGGEKDGVEYGYNFAKDARWPIINNGVYKFVDRHSESIIPSNDADLLNRYSFNFSIALYDLDSNILYYFDIDT